MSAPERNSVPRLAPGCRLNAAGGPEDLLLIPEGALRLKGPARTIVELCNGDRPVRVADLDRPRALVLLLHDRLIGSGRVDDVVE